MNDFTYYTPTKVVFGRRAQDKLGSLLREQQCRKVLLHYGGGYVCYRTQSKNFRKENQRGS